jgi:xanthine/uracil permease
MRRRGFVTIDYVAIATLIAMVVVGCFLLPWAWNQGWIAFIGTLAGLVVGWVLSVFVGHAVLWVLDDWASRLVQKFKSDKSNDEAS